MYGLDVAAVVFGLVEMGSALLRRGPAARRLVTFAVSLGVVVSAVGLTLVLWAIAASLT
jgi:hypothetical protein